MRDAVPSACATRAWYDGRFHQVIVCFDNGVRDSVDAYLFNVNRQVKDESFQF